MSTSPYLFILVTEFLTRQFNQFAQQGALRGIKLVASAPKITHSMYADDLMVLGMATVEEAKEVKAVLTRFGKKSGLVVNPKKSTMWFSRKCDP